MTNCCSYKRHSELFYWLSRIYCYFSFFYFNGHSCLFFVSLYITNSISVLLLENLMSYCGLACIVIVNFLYKFGTTIPVRFFQYIFMAVSCHSNPNWNDFTFCMFKVLASGKHRHLNMRFISFCRNAQNRVRNSRWWKLITLVYPGSRKARENPAWQPNCEADRNERLDRERKLWTNSEIKEWTVKITLAEIGFW